jgi:hypothetical protein
MKCGEWRQNFAGHDKLVHPEGARVLLGLPVTHAPDLRNGACPCNFPTVHHYHGYELDCPCEDCRPFPVRTPSVLNRVGRTVRTMLGRRTIR